MSATLIARDETPWRPERQRRRMPSLVDVVADRTATINRPAFQQSRGKGLYDDGSEAGDIMRGENASPWPGKKD